MLFNEVHQLPDRLMHDNIMGIVAYKPGFFLKSSLGQGQAGDDPVALYKMC